VEFETLRQKLGLLRYFFWKRFVISVQLLLRMKRR
jgi:hypothetical protein